MTGSVLDFLKSDFTQPGPFLLLTLGMFLGVVGRYFLIAGAFQAYFYVWQPARWKARKLGKKDYPDGQFKTEIRWSVVNSLIFAVAGSLTILAYQRGYTAIYLDADRYGYWYLPVSLGLSMVLHETYYYWLHRLMHHPKVYRSVHKVHHDSLITSPWTAFSFHPIEGLLEAVILPLIFLILPMHVGVIGLQLLLMTVSAAVNHLDIEIYPKNRLGTALGGAVIGATHHALHHRQFRFNYGLHFTFWDKWGRTESPQFQQQFAGRKPLD